MDESYFGARRIRGKRGRGAYGKTIVFGLKKRKGNSLYPSYQELLKRRGFASYKFKSQQDG